MMMVMCSTKDLNIKKWNIFIIATALKWKKLNHVVLVSITTEANHNFLDI